MASFFSGWRWIRTTEGVSQQIYSLPHLATLVSTRETAFCAYFGANLNIISYLCKKINKFAKKEKDSKQ